MPKQTECPCVPAPAASGLDDVNMSRGALQQSSANGLTVPVPAAIGRHKMTKSAYGKVSNFEEVSHLNMEEVKSSEDSEDMKSLKMRACEGGLNVMHRNFEWLRRCYVEQGMTIQAMAELAGVTLMTVYHWLKLFEIPTRPKGFQCGPAHPRWKGGEFHRKGGYVYVLMPGHPRANCQQRVKRAVLVAEEMLKRPLRPREVVHHRNGIKRDDRPANIMVFPSTGAHTHYHWICRERNRVVARVEVCQ
jgi:hypothetical protein